MTQRRERRYSRFTRRVRAVFSKGGGTGAAGSRLLGHRTVREIRRPAEGFASAGAPVECGRSRETVKRSELAGWAEYGYCASHSRYFWGLRLHLVCTLHGLPIAFALTGAKSAERDTLLGMFEVEPSLLDGRAGQTLIGDKHYFGRGFEQQLADWGIRLLRLARKGEAERPGAQLFKPLRQVIESINETLKGQLDLERHRGRTSGGVIARVLQRVLALTAAIWHNDHTGQPVKRALTAYDH
ncbi:transposase [Streptomyces aurantiacus]